MTNCLARGKALTIYDVFAGKFDEIGATPSRQSKVEPISSMQLRKLGVFQSAPGDFGRALSVMRAKGSTETEANGQNPPESRPVSWPSLISAEDKHCLAGAGQPQRGAICLYLSILGRVWIFDIPSEIPSFYVACGSLQANSHERFFQTLLSNPCTLGPSGYERPILSGKINKKRHFCACSIASVHAWLRRFIGYPLVGVLLARFATPAGDSDWFESEPYREIPGWYS